MSVLIPPPNSNIAVRFVCCPFLPEYQPALGVSSLASVLMKEGIKADVLYLNVSYWDQIGVDLYKSITNTFPMRFLIGEMVFLKALWGEESEVTLDLYLETLYKYIRETYIAESREALLDQLIELEPQIRILHDQAPALIPKWADEVAVGNPKVVGLSSTFQQNIASLALAKELRRRHSKEEMVILFGGANAEGDMGRALSYSFDFLDHVVGGESENVILGLIKACLSGEHSQRYTDYICGEVVHDMDALPIPDFTDYFQAIKGTRLEGSANLVAESSRGCCGAQNLIAPFAD